MDSNAHSNDKNFNFADYIDYDPEPDDSKSSNIAATENDITGGSSNDKLEKLKQIVIEHIKSTKGQETESFVTKERFVCSICLAIFLEKPQLKEHFIDIHGYEERKPRKTATVVSAAIAAESVITLKKTERPPTPEVVDIPMSNHEDEKMKWLSEPISLKILKQKLYKSFTLKCSVNGCVYQFDNDAKRQTHEKCHVSTDPDQIRQFKCLECQMEIKMWRNCTDHMWRDHEIDIDLLKCPFCSFKAILSVKIFRHLQVHREELKGFECSLCPETFSQFSLLRSHYGTDHIDNGQTDGNSRWYSKKTCEICSNVFANSKTLTKHIKTVHNRIKPFICNVCGYKSARKSTWEVHTRQHTGEKPLVCKHCDFSTADPSVLRKHEMRHNDKTKYKCTECEYSSIQSINFKCHIKRYHPEYYKQLLCDECNFVSVNLDGIRKHIQDHRLGLIRNDDSNDAGPNKFSQPIRNNELSTDCFLPVESTDSFPHDLALDTGGVTIPAHHSDEAQFPMFENE